MVLHLHLHITHLELKIGFSMPIFTQALSYWVYHFYSKYTLQTDSKLTPVTTIYNWVRGKMSLAFYSISNKRFEGYDKFPRTQSCGYRFWCAWHLTTPNEFLILDMFHGPHPATGLSKKGITIRNHDICSKTKRPFIYLHPWGWNSRSVISAMEQNSEMSRIWRSRGENA